MISAMAKKSAETGSFGAFGGAFVHVISIHARRDDCPLGNVIGAESPWNSGVRAGEPSKSRS